MMRRVPEVLDCWFESGSMPFAQVHYPFENREWFDGHFPGDFIVEYIGQTRGWFYTLHVLATALFDRPAVPDLRRARHRARQRRPEDVQAAAQLPGREEVFDTYGSDAMRWFLMASPVLRGGNLIVTEQRGIGRGRPAGAATRCGTPGTSSPCTPTRTASEGGVADRPDRRARPLHPRQDAPARRGRHRAMDVYDLAGARGHISRSSTP